MKTWLAKSVIHWNNFWFQSFDLTGLAVQRICICGLLLWMSLLRFGQMESFSDQGFILRSQALDAFPDNLRPSFVWFFWPDNWNFEINILLVLLFFLLMIGIGGRWIMWLAWILNMGFIQRNWAIGFGGDTLCNLFLFYMMFTQSCARLSILPKRFRSSKSMSCDSLTSAMIRMMQIQLCVIYAYTGFEKLKGGAWWNGTALWEVLDNPQMVSFDFSFLRHWPFLIVMLSFATIIFEIYFPAAMLSRKVRPWWLLAGFLFHIGIVLSLGLATFFVAMTANYFLFMSPQEMRAFFSARLSRPRAPEAR